MNLDSLEKNSLSRKDFLAILGGLAGTAVAAKLVNVKKAATTLGITKGNGDQGAYGNSVYGGKSIS